MLARVDLNRHFNKFQSVNRKGDNIAPNLELFVESVIPQMLHILPVSHYPVLDLQPDSDTETEINYSPYDLRHRCIHLLGI